MDIEYVIKYPKTSKLVVMNPTMGYDPFYRYKMDQLQISYKNNITCIMNYQIFIHQCKTDLDTLTNYFKKKCSTSCKVKDGKLTIQKKLEVNILSEYIQEFLIKYILCSLCGAPELVNDQCNACGHCQK